MKMLNQKDFEEVRVWIHRNARALELAAWNYFFENGPKEEIVSALAFKPFDGTQSGKMD